MLSSSPFRATLRLHRNSFSERRTGSRPALGKKRRGLWRRSVSHRNLGGRFH